MTLATALRLDGTTGNYFSSPDAAGWAITSDSSMIMCISMDDWTPTAQQTPFSKFPGTAGQREWKPSITTVGKVAFVFSIDGSTAITATSTVAPTVSDGASLWIKIDRVASTGVVTFYTSADPPTTAPGSVTWTQLGATVTATSGNIFNSTTEVEVGGFNAGTAERLIGSVYYFEFRNGIGGSVVGSFDPTGVTVIGARNPTTYTDPQANLWTAHGSAWSWQFTAAPALGGFLPWFTAA